MNNAQMRRLVGSFYTAGVDSSAWDASLRDLTEVLHSTTTGLHYYNEDASGGGITRFIGADPEWLQDYDAYYAARNAFMIHGIRLLQSGVTLAGEELCPEDILRRTEWYNDYLVPHRIERVIGVCLFREPGVLSNLTVMRPRKPFSKRELEFVGAAVPHLQQAVRLHRRLEGVTLAECWSAELLDRVPSGVFLLDVGGQVVHMNQTARAQIASRDGLSCDRSVLRASTVAESRALSRAITAAAECALPGSRDILPAESLVRVPRPSLQLPWSVLVTPLSRAPVDVKGIAKVLVIVSDPAHQAHLSPSLLRALFGLSRAEVQVLESLLAGQTVSVAGDRLGISHETARTHVKRILQKTHTERQTDLIGRLTPVSVQTLITAPPAG